MKMKWLQFSFTLLMVMLSVRSNCPKQCKCNDTKLLCYKSLPSFIPETVSHVTAYRISADKILDFSNTDWLKVVHLVLNLQAPANWTERYFFRKLHAEEFTGLKNLEHLKIQCKSGCYLEPSYNSFFGLENVKILDLSDNTIDSLNSLNKVLGGSNILPHLSELYLSNMIRGDIISDFFVDVTIMHNSMKNKPLKILDMSGTNVQFFNSNPHSVPILPQLQLLNISHSGIALFSYHNLFPAQNETKIFKNLQVLDASYPYLPSSGSECVHALVYSKICPFFFTTQSYLPPRLTELYVKNFFKSTVELRGNSNTTYLCLMNNLFNQNINLCVGGNLNILQKLVLSENSIAYIQPDMIYPFKSLKYLDIGSNKLGKAFSEKNYTKSFFNALTQLKVLIISNNSIAGLPKHLFNNNSSLKTLDLSHNKLRSIQFGVQYLKFLEYLDISFNNIVHLDAESCNTFKTFIFRQNLNSSKSQHTVQSKIQLVENPISCTCENICFLKLILELKETNTCLLKDQQVIINEFSIKETEYTCKESIVIIVFSTTVLVIIMLIASTGYFIIKEHKHVKMTRLKEAGIEMYGTSRRKHVVFLSFSGDDAELVMTKVYPKLESGLKQVLNTDTDCVATGGTSFKPGYPINAEIARCIEDSSIVIFFLSETFIKKPWCRAEVHKAFCDEKPIVLMIWEKLNTDAMPRALHKHYETFTRVHWSVEHGEPVMRPSWDHLCETVVGLIGTNR